MIEQPEFITVEQIQQRNEWERMLMTGALSLADGLMLMLQTGAPATPYLLARLESALQAYQYGGADADLAKEFGVRVSQRERRAMDRLTWVSHVKYHVDAFHEKGFTKQDPSQFDGTAFHEAAKLLHRSPSQLFDTYYKG